MDGRVADADAPDLGIGVAGQQALAGGQGIFRHLEGSTVHVEGHDLSVIAGLHLGTHVLLVKGRAAAGMLFFAVARLRFRHGDAPSWLGEVCTESYCSRRQRSTRAGRTTPLSVPPADAEVQLRAE